MRVEVTIGVPHPDLVDKAAVLAVLPHGTGTVEVVEGGLEIAERRRHRQDRDRQRRGGGAARYRREAGVMTAKRVILEIGSGNDLHGGDYTKAAVRAVEDALHHSSLTLIRTLGLDARKMQVEVTIGVQRPERVDAAAVKAALPHGARHGQMRQGRSRRARRRDRRCRGHRQRRGRGPPRPAATLTPEVAEARYSRAATAAISTFQWGAARRASTQARAGVLPGDTQASHTAFMAS